ncbi:DsrE family protein [Ferrovum sp.]|uniref:DsrE/DsrF/TusD sulfur relay family protein n=1 Tax=Ferrovum sp. TaxID=2609467 RepID=UPI002627D29C|nr:DsrE family protein [Ferrovum sp.]
MKILFIINDGPYGNERPYNALRLAGTLSGRSGSEVKAFLIGDAANCAKSGQKVPEGFYNIQIMLNKVIRSGEVGVCGTCMAARGITDADLVEGSHKSTMTELAEWTEWADKVLVF